MYTDSAYWHNKMLDFKDKRYPIFVGSCGTYKLSSRPILPTHRPRGRLDYQIIYIASGKAHFYFNGKKEIVSAGNMVLYRPKEEQRYYYYGKDHTEVYWVHFTGNNVKNLLRKYGIPDNTHVIHTGSNLEYKQLFLQMIQELKLCKDDYEEMLTYHLLQLLILIHRIQKIKPRNKDTFVMNEIDNAIRYFHDNYNKSLSIEEYSSSHNMSISWFIHKFKEYTNLTPTQYIISLRICNAQTLLESTNYNVTEIANIVGYDNPLYFSRIFKKQSGMSPTEFRKQFDKLIENESL